MALSDVTVKVNLVTSAGVEPVWFPLFVAYGASSPGQPIDSAAELSYTEFTTLQQFLDALANYSDSDTRQKRKEKKEKVKQTILYQEIEMMYRQNGHPNRFAVIVKPGENFDAVKSEITTAIDEGWRQIVPTDGFTNLECFKLAEYIENLEQRKMLFFQAQSVSYKTAEDTRENKTYVLSDYTRTVAVYHPANFSACAAVVGATAGKTPGSLNYRNVIVQGIEPVALTEEELDQLHEDGFMTLVERAGDTVTSTGKSASGERYIDTIDIEDYVVQQLIYTTQKALNVNDIVPYNNDGISILENAAVSVMRDCADKGMIAKTDTNTYEYEVNYPAISYVPEEDIASRTYKLGTVSFTVQGAVDKVEITVDMTL